MNMGFAALPCVHQFYVEDLWRLCFHRGYELVHITQNLSSKFIYLSSFLFFYLKGEGQVLISWFISQSLGHAEVRSFVQVFHMGGEGPRTWVILQCLE